MLNTKFCEDRCNEVIELCRTLIRQRSYLGEEKNVANALIAM